MNQKVCSKFWANITSINADASKPESPGHVFLNPAKGDTSRYHRSCVERHSGSRQIFSCTICAVQDISRSAGRVFHPELTDAEVKA